MSNDKFTEDILKIVEKAVSIYGVDIRNKLSRLSSKLIELHRMNRVKINHSIMEIVMGAYFIDRGYEVDVEADVGDKLIADVVAYDDKEKILVEIETGFTSPENALDPQSYLMARIVSKLARYSKHSDIFSFATPLHNVLQIPRVYLKPSKERRREEMMILKDLCDRYYSQPPITIEDIARPKIDSIYLINVDTLRVKKQSLKQYMKTTIGKYMPKTIEVEKYVGWSQHSEQVRTRSAQPYNSQAVHP
ncbi:MAG: hypothetical protein NZ929_03285 [Aigarchaeota archaeon]|nr:hypothetical protein [Aigarchaeota archaeon]MDW7986574.1 hypothetical protein [Nitrososphaerota archaeon]